MDIYLNYNIILYLLSIIIILSSLGVIFSKNPIYSILFLILVFLNIIIFITLCEAEFLALIFLIVYIGAIAILFLFIVMMLNLKILEFNDSFIRYIPLATLVILILFFEVYFILNRIFYSVIYNQFNYLIIFENNYNLELLSYLLYTYYFIFFIFLSFILLISIISVISLTLQKSIKYKSQKFYKQIFINFYKTSKFFK